MGRRHSIAAKKAAGDAKKSQTYTKIGKIIEMASRNGGDDAKMNPALELALQKARYYGLPREVIDKAIKKGAGKLEGEQLQQIFYEGYGPGGVALLIKCITPNTNRTSADVRTILNKFGGNMGEMGSVGRQFVEKGIIYISGKIEKSNNKGKDVENILPLNPSEFENFVLGLEVEDFEFNEGIYKIVTSKENFVNVKSIFDQQGYKIEQADLEYTPSNMMNIDASTSQSLDTLIDALENNEDVDSIYHNAN